MDVVNEHEPNSFDELANYFGSVKPVTLREFFDFWLSCNDQERAYFRRVDLSTGLDTGTTLNLWLYSRDLVKGIY